MLQDLEGTSASSIVIAPASTWKRRWAKFFLLKYVHGMWPFCLQCRYFSFNDTRIFQGFPLHRKRMDNNKKKSHTEVPSGNLKSFNRSFVVVNRK